MASINADSNDTMYLAYRFAGPSADLIVPAVALYAVALVGIVLNATVLVVTARNRSLRGTANFLIAVLCLCELIHQLGHTFFVIVVISGTNFVSLFTANIFMAPMIFTLNCGLMSMFCAAFDRLLAVAVPFFHLQLRKNVYLSAHVSICVIYGLLILFLVFAYAFENAGNPTTAFIAETLLGPVGYKFFFGSFILCLASACCYVAIFLIIRSKNGVGQQNNNNNTRLLRSMVIILSISIGGYVVNLSIYQLLYAFGHFLGSAVRVWQFGFIAAILLNVVAGSNAVVLYFNSSEYRRAFGKELRALAQSFGIKNAVHPSTGATNHLRSSNLNQPIRPIRIA